MKNTPHKNKTSTLPSVASNNQNVVANVQQPPLKQSKSKIQKSKVPPPVPPRKSPNNRKLVDSNRCNPASDDFLDHSSTGSLTKLSTIRPSVDFYLFSIFPKCGHPNVQELHYDFANQMGTLNEFNSYQK